MSNFKIRELIITMRPKQWVKNIVIFSALFFSQDLFNPPLFLKVLYSLILFTLLSGSIYIFNDLIDIEQDRRHPFKSKRPLASGKMTRSTGVFSFIVLGSGSLILSFLLSQNFGFVTLSYFILQILYTYYLKHIIILDVFCVAAGFLLRVLAGAVVISVPISTWLLICTMLLALFLSFCKRRHELFLLEDEAVNHRTTLSEYSSYLLDQMISVVTASTFISYVLYTISEETIRKFKTTHLKYTIPFVLFGIFRYLYLIHQREGGGSPETILLKDKPMLLNILFYAITAAIILYI